MILSSNLEAVASNLTEVQTYLFPACRMMCVRSTYFLHVDLIPTVFVMSSL
jgi:hypothetical protein